MSSQNEVSGKSTTASTSCSLFNKWKRCWLSCICLDKEESLLHKQAAKVGTISADKCTITDAVGPTLYVDLMVDGVPVQAKVDTGSQSTIISPDLSHWIGKHLTNQGKPLPQLKVPSVRLYSKDRKKTMCELKISTEALLTVEADGSRIQTPVFIQSDSDQLCLLGMNAAPSLN